MKSLPALCVVLWALTLLVFGQNPVDRRAENYVPDLDRLQNKLEATPPGTSRIPILFELIALLERNKSHLLINYLEMAIDLCREAGDKKNLATLLYKCGAIYYQQGDGIRAGDFYQQSLSLWLELGDQKNLAIVYNDMGNVSTLQGEHTRALEFYFKSVELKKKTGQNKLVPISLNNIAIIYYNRGDYRIALDYSFQSMKLNEEYGDKKGLEYSLTNIGVTYDALGMWDQAWDCFVRSQKISEELGNKSRNALAYINLGYLSQEKGNNQKALGFFYKALEQITQTDNLLILGEVYYFIGFFWGKQGKYDQALPFWIRAMDYFTRIQFKDGLARVYLELGKYHREKGDDKKALEFFQRTYQVAIALPVASLIRDSAAELAAYYAKQARFQKAYTFLLDYKKNNDLLTADENIKKCIRLEMQYDYDKKEKQKEVEQQKKDLQKAVELRQHRLQKTIFTGIAIFVALVFFVLFIVKRRDNQRLSKEIRHRIQTQGELLVSKKLETVGILSGGIAHDFNNILNLLSGNLEQARSSLVSQSGEACAYLQKAQNATLQAADLVKNLLTLSEGGWGEKKNLALTHIVQQIKKTPEAEHIPFSLSLPPDLPLIKGDDRQIQQLLLNLLVNADEATQNTGREKQISLSAAPLVLTPDNPFKLNPGEYIQILVADNGVGIPSSLLERVFDPYFSTKQRGVQKGMGLSLAVCMSVVQSHFGHIYLTPQPDGGTAAHILLPVAETQKVEAGS